MEELEAKTTDRTRVIALSHVQFASGYAADLKRLGDFCGERGIDLVIDAAQSLGALPIHPERYGIAAVTGAAWKWLLASRGLGLFYTTPTFREKLADSMAGDAMMSHRLDYLNRNWEPFPGARRYEYSTLPWEHLVGLETVLDEVFLRYGMQAIAQEVFRLQDTMLDALDPDLFAPLRFPDSHRSGILALRPRSDPTAIVETLRAQGVVATTQGGYLRLAPHFYLTDDDVVKAAEALNRAG
jgi:selenocysteine lyase/cysteine desulfurase